MSQLSMSELMEIHENMIRPVYNEGDNLLEYIGRLQEWEAQQHNEAVIEGKRIDSMYMKRRTGQKNERVVTKQVMNDRKSIYDLAENNPVLRNIIKGLNKELL